jgi:hypothetical protein
MPPRKPGSRSPKVDDGFAWEAPPEHSINSKYSEPIEKIRKNPGRWARIKVSGSGPAYSGRRIIKNMVGNDPHWEIIVRRLEKVEGNQQKEARYGLYVRYRNDDQMNEGK